MTNLIDEVSDIRHYRFPSLTTGPVTMDNHYYNRCFMMQYRRFHQWEIIITRCFYSTIVCILIFLDLITYFNKLPKKSKKPRYINNVTIDT